MPSNLPVYHCIELYIIHTDLVKWFLYRAF